MAIIEEFIELVTTDCGAGDERAIADKLKIKLTELGCEVFEDPNEAKLLKGNAGNVYAVLHGTTDGVIMLCSHMDRVANGRGISPVIEDGIMRANGTILASDDVAGISAILDGIRRAKASGKPYPTIELVFTCCEEDGIRGSRIMDYSRIKSKNCYVFDASGRVGKIVTSAAGRASMKVNVTGLAAHAGNVPEKGINALLAAAHFLTRVPQGRLDKQSTANFSTVIAEGPTNVITDRATLFGEVRSHDEATILKYLEDAEALCRTIEKETGAKFDFESEMDFYPFSTEAEAEIVVRAKKVFSAMDVDPFTATMGGGMDANNFARHGIASVGIATGYYENHTTKEYLVISDLEKAGEFAANLICEWA